MGMKWLLLLLPVFMVACTSQPSNMVAVAGKKDSVYHPAAIIRDTVPSTEKDLNIVISYEDAPMQQDYVAEHESGVDEKSEYAKWRGVDKGQIHFPCNGKRLHEFSIPKNRITCLIVVKYNMTVLDRTDYVFTTDSIFEIHTTTADAGVFTDSDIEALPQPGTKQNNPYCDFNEYTFSLVKSFCERHNIKTR